MKKLLLIFAFLCSLCSFSQVRDDFSDGDFTAHPVWDGDVKQFIIDKEGQLRLNDLSKKGGISYLSTPSSLLKESAWEFYVHLFFNPSANNFARFYLGTDSPVLSGNLKGYYVAVGGIDDNISLCYQEEGKTYELIKGISKMKGISSPQLQVRVQCDQTGNWTLWSCLLGAEEDFMLEGTTFDMRLDKVSFAGIYCCYTSSHGKAFVFDDIIISGESEENPSFPDDTPSEPDEPVISNPDNDRLPPRLLSLYATTDTTVYIEFNEAVNIRQASFVMDKQHVCRVKELSKDKKKINLRFSGCMQNNTSYVIELSGIKDIYGNEMAAASIGFIYYDLSMHPAKWGDVVFSEIMVHPSAIKKLPDVEYVELYNRKETPLYLKGWTFYYGNKGYPLPEALITPHGYLILCAEKWINEWEKRDISVTGLTSFPILADAGKLLYLEDARGQLVAWVHYADTWYGDSFKRKGGFSLECINTDNLSGSAENWTACTDLDGGTPGRENSVHGNFSDEEFPEIQDAFMQSADTIMIFFNKPIQLSSLRSFRDYQIVSPLSMQVKAALPDYPEGKYVKLSLSAPLEEEQEIEIRMPALTDLSDFELEKNFIVRTALPQDAFEGEVVLNEILFNPRTGGSDYVEVYNNSTHYIRLHTLFFSTLDAAGLSREGISLAKEPRVFPPHTYLCFTKNVKAICEQYKCSEKQLVELDDFPVLPDDKGNILLLSASGEQLDRLFYSEKMHNAFLSDKEGVSLEKNYPMLSSSSFSHWLSASSASGGGTPGYQNSQYREPVLANEETFRLEHASFSPNGDGYEDVLAILYHFTSEGYQADVKIYNDRGELVSILAKDFRLASEGSFIWDGRDKNDRLVTVGLYIIYVEAYSPQGESKHFKLVCALTR